MTAQPRYIKTLSAAVMLAMALSACSGNKDDNGGSSPATSASAGEDAGIPTDPFGAYPETVKVTFGKYQGQEVKFEGSDTIDDNVIMREYKEKLNIEVQNAWVVKGTPDQYDQKMNVVIASNELPDLMYVNAQQLKQLVEADLVQDLAPVLEKYGSPFAKDVMTQDGGNAIKSATFDGKLYAIPQTGSNIDSTPILWVREDWRKKMNLPEPKTLDDFLKLSEAFTKQDPDGNGKADTYGLGVGKDLWGGMPGLEGFFNIYGAFPSNWIQGQDGSLVYGSVQPEVKTALAKLSELYKQGEIDPEFASKDGGKVAEAATSGKLGMYFGAMWTPLWPLQDGKKQNPDMEWQAYAVPSLGSEPAKVSAAFPVSHYYAVRKGFKNPEAAIKLLNLDMERQWGSMYDPVKYWSKDRSIEFRKYAIYPEAEPSRRNLNTHYAIVDAMSTKDTSKLNAEEQDRYTQIVDYLEKGDLTGWGYERVFGTDSSFTVIDQYVKNNLVNDNAFYGAPTEAMGEKSSALSKMQLESFTKIIMGAASIDTFDKYVTDWQKLGGSEIQKEVNDWKALQK
ncbi:extracellular solute-binding protein [Cohnella sp. GCM10020058]|uniref:extracellular solute-binding protein n=1 Tax=Cohnella sp. GCM10020058 TaxID=3317330 RepID=UPI00363B55EA